MVGFKLFLVLIFVLVVSRAIKVRSNLVFVMILTFVLVTFFYSYSHYKELKICEIVEQKTQNVEVDNSNFDYWSYLSGKEQEISVFDGKRIYPIKVKISEGAPELYIPTSANGYYKKL